MTPEEQLKFWIEDPVIEYAFVFASDFGPASRGLERPCDACGRPVSVWPVVVEKQRENSKLKVLCRSLCLPITLKIKGPMPFYGNVSNNQLPEKLKKF
jgi:hypothetical protein